MSYEDEQRRLQKLYDLYCGDSDNENRTQLPENFEESEQEVSDVPIKFMFAKETLKLILEEELKIESNIKNLSDFEIVFKEKRLRVNYTLLMTMLDGSTINTLPSTNATQKCFICRASPKEINLESVTKKNVKVENFNFGLSSMHS
ncbi:unnamed protein product [Psylliodes chrysocephalus]|uniref:Uncharacterized protein n=1 Tax=Psylliodes chrysocephalus TaxID=3402493 RepID=A0A9P0CU68_9CUCU|nr:unnamed protein product [Psylliodes chrysocephala]